MYMVSLLLPMGVALVAGVPQQNDLNGAASPRGFQCPELFGTFEDPVQCDKFWECEEGIAKEKLCDDGLVFDIFKANAGIPDPCESPYVVDCGERSELQEPSFTSEFCPRRNGIFADPDPSVCNKFYTCIKGLGVPTVCSAGLHFDETNGNCAWPATAGRKGCGSVKNCIGEFCCSGEGQLTADGVENPHPTYPNLVDCQKFWVCLNKITPQESSCTLGQVYNEKSTLCDYPENVPECENWFIDNPLFDVVYDDTNADGIIDFGIRRDFSQTSIN